MENQGLDNHKDAWSKRQERYGNTPRSVLYKGLPDSLNQRLHRLHVEFILKSLPRDATSMLDVGCGYGRISGEILRTRIGMEIHGVELCPAFAKKFNEGIGPCFIGLLEDFVPERGFDVVLMVTILMYQNRSDLPDLLMKYWNAVSEGGSLICIEPYENVLVRRRQRQNERARGVVPVCKAYYFKAGELLDIMSKLPGAKLQRQRRFGLLPLVDLPVLHDAVTVVKEK